MKCDKNPILIKNMFDEISNYYDKMNDFISLGTHYVIKKLVLKKLAIKQNSKVLDLCCGTGDFTKIISKLEPSAEVTGADFSPKMLELAHLKNPSANFTQADATSIPFRDCEFDYVTMGFGLRNIENRQQAIEEVFRVLKTNGQFLQLDFGCHNKISKIFNLIVPILAKIFKVNSKHYEYLINSKESFPEPEELIKEFEHAGFKLVKKYDFLFGSISCQIVEKYKK